MATVKVSGKLNAQKAKAEIEEVLKVKIEELQKRFPQLERMFKDGTISIETKVVIKKTTKARLIFSESIDEEDIGDIHHVAERYVKGSMPFYDDVSLKLEAGGEETPPDEEPPAQCDPSERLEAPKKNILEEGIQKLDPSVRLLNCLEQEGIKTLGDLVQRTTSDLLEIRNFGPTCLAEVRHGLKGLGLALKNERIESGI